MLNATRLDTKQNVEIVRLDKNKIQVYIDCKEHTIFKDTNR